MTQNINIKAIAAAKDFKLPRYSEIPNVGLYLEQVSKYITECLEPIPDSALTGSMISNYVKKKLVSNPVKKQYSRDQIAYLIFIAIAKSALSMEEIKILIEKQPEKSDTEAAYEYFRNELETVFGNIFGLFTDSDAASDKSYRQLPHIPDTPTAEQTTLRVILLIFCYKALLDFTLSRAESTDEERF